ncbi:site-specific integrase [Terrabacter sp. Root85]|uniref:site-specific integrase n=1 Tax=Terrabacter sp. Root85 TaxID=1736603 RepID=UPI000AA25253|nr:tyrosine-type recombinase/integrase [Terrabacter sp. Root85]
MTNALAMRVTSAQPRPGWRRRYDRAMNTLMLAALPATARPAIPPTPTDDPDLTRAGLTPVDAARIGKALAAARTAGTRRLYDVVWGQWQRWCAERGVAAVPADPLAVCAYLTERAEAGRATGTLDMACTVIRHVHRTTGAVDPIASEAVRQVRRGLRRTYGGAARRLARPLSVEEIRQIVGSIDRTTPHGIRDAAIILLGYASALRRAELVALDLADIEHKPAGLVLHIRQSKTDQEGHGEQVAVAHGQHALTDPVAALNAWRDLRGETPGALFTRIWGSAISSERLSGHVPARMLRSRAIAAGLDGTRITAHSLRAGHATTAALAGVPLNRIAAQTRHKDLGVLVNRYIRPLEALENTSSKDLGL